MASYTTNLNLLKKDPVADASDTFNITTMLNENWDKIDAAMGAARAAEAYSTTKPYAVGDYCTRNGALFKCTVAITTPEVWTAGHWKATSIGAEFKAIYAALVGKVNANNHTIVDLDTAITTGHWTWVDSDGVFGLTGAMYNIDVSSADFNANQAIIQTATRSYPINASYPSITLKRTYYFTSGWTTWVTQATATPPTEYDLPLSSGWSAARLKYLKTQDGMVTLDGYEITSGSTGTGAWKIATLPAGHRPGNAVFAVVTNYTTGAMTTVSELIIDQDGNVFLHRTDTSATKHAVCVTFRAAD